MAVYCKNCKYFGCIPQCKVNLKPVIDCTGFEYYTGWLNPYVKNQDYNCKDYHRKFWLFWIKESKKK